MTGTQSKKMLKIGRDVQAPVSVCNGCGAPILWAKDAAGKAIPLDPRAVVYRISQIEMLDSGHVSRLKVEKMDTHHELAERQFVSHFCTCPKASMFSKSGRAPA